MVLSFNTMPKCHGGSPISSNQSSTKWKIIAARIKWNCARICEILKEMSQEEEHPDPENAEVEIQIQETETEAHITKIQNPELEAKATSITDPQQQQNFSTIHQIQKTPMIDQVSKSISNKKSDLDQHSTLQIEEIIEKGKQPKIIATVQHTKNSGGDEDRRAVGGAPPLDIDDDNKPPDQSSGKDDVFSGSESSGTEVGASIKGKGKKVVTTAMTNGAPGTEMSNRRLHHRGVEANRSLWHASPIATKPLTLLATVFPWGRESETRMENIGDRVMESNVPLLAVEDRASGGAFARPWVCRRKLQRVASETPSFRVFRNNDDWWKVTPATARRSKEDVAALVTGVKPQVVACWVEEVAAILARKKLCQISASTTCKGRLVGVARSSWVWTLLGQIQPTYLFRAQLLKGIRNRNILNATIIQFKHITSSHFNLVLC